ncbi:BofC C-terminal domain-containing protein [Lutispora sp.]|nr:BofC C-terminal domain-containing protein [Lutispora sp.]MEA4963525.1 BofC C-terminal domain-containing protein [Lutispora sp.]
MFEDKRKGKKKFIVFIMGLMLFIAFSISYYINMGTENEANSFNKINENLKVPESLKNFTKVDVDNVINANEIAIEEDFVLNEHHKINYVTSFTICGHKIEKTINLPPAFTGLSEEEFMKNNTGWSLAGIDEDFITLTKDIETYCPRHFIIGIEGEYIAIYVYNDNGEKILKEKTDIIIDTLTPEDQIMLQSGIVADTEDDMEQKLEGFSN